MSFIELIIIVLLALGYLINLKFQKQLNFFQMIILQIEKLLAMILLKKNGFG